MNRWITTLYEIIRDAWKQNLTSAVLLVFASTLYADDNKTLRVFIFAGQSNMVGSDSKSPGHSAVPSVCWSGSSTTRHPVLILPWP